MAILALLVIAFVLAACGTAGSVPAAREGGAAFGPLPGAPAPGVDTSGGTPKGDLAASLADRKIVKTGDISIQVPNVPSAVGKVRALALELGGYVADSQSGTLDQSATLTLRVPAARLDDALAGLHKLDGDVLSEATKEEDVTTAVIDLEARLKNLQASEVQYRTLLTQAVKIDDILAVQTRLDDVRGQIEQFQAQDKELTGLADLATLTVSLTPGAVQQATSNWDPGKTVTNAYAALVGVGQAFVNGAIWFAIVWLPALVLLGIVALLARRFVPGLRRRVRSPVSE